MELIVLDRDAAAERGRSTKQFTGEVFDAVIKAPRDRIS